MVTKILQIEKDLTGIPIHAALYVFPKTKNLQVELPQGIPVSTILLTNKTILEQLSLLYTKYIRQGAEWQINLSSSLRNAVAQHFEGTANFKQIMKRFETSPRFGVINDRRNTPNNTLPIKRGTNRIQPTDLSFATMHHRNNNDWSIPGLVNYYSNSTSNNNNPDQDTLTDDKINDDLISVFDSAAVEIFSLLGDMFNRFKTTIEYGKLAQIILKSKREEDVKSDLQDSESATDQWRSSIHNRYQRRDSHTTKPITPILAAISNYDRNDGYTANTNSNSNIDTSTKYGVNLDAESTNVDRESRNLVLNQWLLHEIIGKGAFGIVHRATHIITNREFAIKFSIQHVQDSRYQTELELETAKNEIKILKKLTALSHPNVIRLEYQNYRYTYRTQQGFDFETVLLVMEYAPNGQLFDILRYCGPFNHYIARIYFEQIISALGFFHNNGIVHRDLKTENMLLNAFFDLKICDFGLSIVLENKNDSIKQVGKVGTKGYIAPEILRRKKYDASCDIFSAGVILFILLTARYPFSEATTEDEKYKILIENGNERSDDGVCKQFWKAVNDGHSKTIDDVSVQGLIESMIRYDPKQRITIQDIEKNSWYCHTEENDEAVKLYDIMNEKYKQAQINKNKKKNKHTSKNSNTSRSVGDIKHNPDIDMDDDIIDQQKTLAEFESCLSQFGTSIVPATHGATLTPIDELKQMNPDTDNKENENIFNPKGSGSKRSSLLQSIQQHLGGGDAISKLSSCMASNISSQLSSQVTSAIVSIESLKCYRICDPLVVMVGIGDYDDELQNLIGITKDYKNMFYTFNNIYNYSLFYQTKDNEQIYVKNRILNLKKEHLSQKIKVKWNDNEIIDFFIKARDIVVQNKHDSLLALISSHGDSEGVIYDSNFEDVQLFEIFGLFMRNKCPHLQDKPKIFFVDACRGSMKSLNQQPNSHIKNNNNNNQDVKLTIKGINTGSSTDNNNVDQNDKQPNVSQQQTTVAVVPLEIENSNEQKQTDFDEKKKSSSINASKIVTDTETVELVETNTNSEEKKQDLGKFEEKWLPYHNEANFQIVYANIDGYAVIEAGKKGGYLIQAVKKVFCEQDRILVKDIDLNDVVLHINQEAQKMVGTAFSQQVQQVSQMDCNVKFAKGHSVLQY